MPPAPIVKVLLTHRAAAKVKYAPSGWTKIRQAVTALTTADKARGITTRLLAVDSAADAAKVGATKVDSPADAQALKAFMDRVFEAWKPAYVAVLGGPELFAQVLLDNPLWTGDPADDPDRFIPSDLPYACDEPFSSAANAFRSVTRVVGRIPDLTGVADPAVLVDQLKAAAGAAGPVALTSATPVFALGAKVWRVSTQLSLSKLPTTPGPLQLSPTAGPAWTKDDLAPTIHFVNCHGAEFDPRWYGQATASQTTLPTTVDAGLLTGLIGAGTVVSTECCYGTTHWPPPAAAGQPSIAMTYLMQGASGVFGASSTSYGPATTNEYADVITRLFLEEVMGGASLGRAAMMARQRFIQGQAFLDPTDVKTLAQFELLGDPSLQPFTGSPGVLARRTVAAATGDALGRTVLVSDAQPRGTAGLSRPRLSTLVGRDIPSGTTVRTFDCSSSTGSLRMSTGGDAGVGPVAGPVAHVAFLPSRGKAARTLVVVRDQPGTEPEVRVVYRR